jgi:hypothetical protein
MADSFAHVRRDVFGVGNTRACPSVGVAVVYGAKVLIVRECGEVRSVVVHVAVDGASIKLSGGGKGVVYGGHKRGGEGPVVAKVEFAPLGVNCFRARVVSL